MTPRKRAAIVGCGGISCALVPIISRMMDLVLIDADKYEVGNVNRQFPALHSTENKARVLMEMCQPNTLNSILHIPFFVQDAFIINHEEWKGVDIIIGCVDNAKSRHILKDLALDLEIPAILAGNEHMHGEAHAVFPGIYNPMDHFSFVDGGTVPWACNSDKNLEEHPQTAIANALAAAAVIQLLHSMQSVQSLHNAIAYTRLEPLSSITKRVKDLLREKDELARDASA